MGEIQNVVPWFYRHSAVLRGNLLYYTYFFNFIAVHFPVYAEHFDFMEMAGIFGGCGPPNYSYKIRDTWVPIKSPRGSFRHWYFRVQPGRTLGVGNFTFANDVLDNFSSVRLHYFFNFYPLKCDDDVHSDWHTFPDIFESMPIVQSPKPVVFKITCLVAWFIPPNIFPFQ